MYKILSYLLSFADFWPTKFMSAFASSPILNISIVSFSSSLNRLNALTAVHKLVSVDNAQNLSLSFSLAKLASLLKMPSLKVDMYLILTV